MASIIPACPRCSKAMLPGENFCSGCGTALTSTDRGFAGYNRPNLSPQTDGPRRRSGLGAILAFIFLVVGLLFVVFAINGSSSNHDGDNKTTETDNASTVEPTTVEPQSTKEKTGYIGETVQVGYWSYRINGSQWLPFLDSYGTMERPDAAFLVLDISARNDDRTASTLPPIKLINEAGQEFSESSAGAMSSGFFGPLKELNPGVTSRGMVAFDVPQGAYMVLLPGGFTSSAKFKVELSQNPSLRNQTPSSPTPAQNPPTETAPPTEQQDVSPQPAGVTVRDQTPVQNPPPN
jgi:hypothetical protein